MSPWRPRESDPDYDVLREGVPDYMKPPLQDWLAAAVGHDPAGISQAFDTAQRFAHLGYAGANGTTMLLGALFQMGDPLEFVDFVLYQINEDDSDFYNPELIPRLERILQQNGSAWRVGHRGDGAGLERRVPEGVSVAVESTISTAGLAGQLLAEAWRAIFSREPDTEEAYEKAIKAVEEAAANVVSPGNARATLGTIASQMESQRDWGLALSEDPRHPSSDVVLRMVRALWHGQESRHGGNGYRRPTQGEAEAGVLLAVPLVQWFSSGAVARRGL